MATLSKTLEEALKHDSWTLEEAAWILAGFSSLGNPMKLTRLADNEEVIFGTPDYGYARAEKEKIYEMLEQLIQSQVLLPRSLRDKYGKDPLNWRVAPIKLIRMLTFARDLRGLNTFNLNIPWLELASEHGLIPREIAQKGKEIPAATSISIPGGTSGGTEAARAETQFQLNAPKNHSDLFHAFLYDILFSERLQGNKRPTRDKLINIIDSTSESLFIKVGKSPVGVKCPQSIYYYNDEGNETFMTFDALKQYILDNTTVTGES